MKVLFVRSNPVMPDSRVEKEIAVLLKQGYEISILAWDRKNDYPLRKETLNVNMPNVAAFRVGIKSAFGSGMKNIKQLLKYQREIRKFLHKNTFDIVHACDFDTAFTAYHSIDHKKTRFVYDIFDYYADAFSIPSFLRKPVVFLDRKIINHANITIICTEGRREQIKGANPQRVVVLHNSPPQYQGQGDVTRDDAVIRIVYFGIFSASRLIKELLDVVVNEPRFELHIGGFGALEDHIKQAAARYSNVIFYGTVPYEEVLKIEQSCDIMTAIYDPKVRNHYYAAPNKFYEALMLGKPVIMAKGTGMSDVVIDNDIGVAIEYTEEGLRQGLIYLLKKKSTWTEMSSRMIQLYDGEYSWEEMQKRLIAAYSSLQIRRKK